MLGIVKLRGRSFFSKNRLRVISPFARFLTEATSGNLGADPTTSQNPYQKFDVSQTTSHSKSWFERDHPDPTKFLRGEIIKLFATTPTAQQLDEFMNTRLVDCRNLEISQLLHFWGKKKVRIHHNSMKAHLPAIWTRHR